MAKIAPADTLGVAPCPVGAAVAVSGASRAGTGALRSAMRCDLQLRFAKEM
jgi:hypothetical protein